MKSRASSLVSHCSSTGFPTVSTTRVSEHHNTNQYTYIYIYIYIECAYIYIYIDRYIALSAAWSAFHLKRVLIRFASGESWNVGRRNYYHTTLWVAVDHRLPKGDPKRQLKTGSSLKSVCACSHLRPEESVEQKQLNSTFCKGGCSGNRV